MTELRIDRLVRSGTTGASLAAFSATGTRTPSPRLPQTTTPFPAQNAISATACSCVHPHFREVVQLLAVRAADQARRVEVRRENLRGTRSP